MIFGLLALMGILDYVFRRGKPDLFPGFYMFVWLTRLSLSHYSVRMEQDIHLLENRIDALIGLARRMREIIDDQRIELAKAQAINEALSQHISSAQLEIDARQRLIDDAQIQNRLLANRMEEARLRLQDLLGEIPEPQGRR